MSEATVVNLFTVVRILLVGGIFIVIPRITRKGLLFGAYVGEEFAETDSARALVRRWYVGCLMIMGLCLAVGLGISVAGRPVAGNFTATAILLLCCPGLYLSMYYTARGMVPPAAARQADVAAAPLEEGQPKGTTLAKAALAICIVVGLATVVYATVNYTAMPQRVPIHFDSAGEADAWTKRSVAVMLAPSLNLVISTFLALLALLTAGAKRSVRGGSGGRSVEAQSAFRATLANLISGTALFTCALMTFLSVQMIRIASSQIRSLGIGIGLIAGAMVLFTLVGLIRIMSLYGQGGALLEEGSPEAPLTNGLADNTNWYWGIFYVNRNDPSIMVEKRFGLGYTMNYGNPTAVLIVVTFSALTLGLTALGLIAAMS